MALPLRISRDLSLRHNLFCDGAEERAAEAIFFEHDKSRIVISGEHCDECRPYLARELPRLRQGML
jgi:hypothetical protein